MYFYDKESTKKILETTELEIKTIRKRLNFLKRKKEILLSSTKNIKFNIKNEQELFNLAYDFIVEREENEATILDVCFNLCLIYLKKRKAFLIEYNLNYVTDDNNTDVYTRIMTFIDALDSFVYIMIPDMGNIICLQENETEIKEYIQDDFFSCERIGLLLGLPYAADLSEIHKHKERFSVNLEVCLLKDEQGFFGNRASFMSMVGTEEHNLDDIMKIAREFRDIGRTIDPCIRITFEIAINNRKNRKKKYFRDQCHIREKNGKCLHAENNFDNSKHIHGKNCGHDEIIHLGHIDYVVGNEVHHQMEDHYHTHAILNRIKK